jgi:uncharacterized protein
MEAWLYYLWALLLVLACGVAWLTTLVTLPGNWIIAGFAALFAWLLPETDGRGISWTAVGVLFGCALLGEVVEFAASAGGAAKQLAIYPSYAESLFCCVVGSTLGLTVGIPIPVLGPFMMALLGGAAGAFYGAYLGEAWKGRPHEERIAVGRGAFTGRIWGTVGKLAVGAIMLVMVAWDAFF